MKILLGILIGAGIGYAIGFVARCTQGICPLTSNPVILSLVGALLGAMLAAGK
ncbi:MAG: hypothetical protein KKH80_04040 [Candidatus Omnitrophica bacterium]|nr:hypothetical protein [Candidatus Omnitrophota bacterium]MBU1871950.1 hypothetical protein [Candidatus Omnitrophota bacterium]